MVVLSVFFMFSKEVFPFPYGPLGKNNGCPAGGLIRLFDDAARAGFGGSVLRGCNVVAGMGGFLEAGLAAKEELAARFRVSV